MKLKSTLWALALACAAVSCSDDLDSPNGNENSDGNKSSTYMKVTVNAGVVTRAGESEILPPTGGEDGDGSEVGLVNEYRVTDVTVILYKNVRAGDTNDTYNTKAFTSQSVIVGAGYATTSGSMGAGDEGHSKSATVMVKAKEQNESFDGNYYGVIAVTNWGDETLKNRVLNTKGFNATNLANLLVPETHSLEGSLNTKFIMSSHKKEGEIVQLKANATEETAPSVSVHVERLAAKVRINPTDGVTNYIYTVGKDANETAKVRLDNVVLVNKLTSGSYLLKRVTSDVTTGDGIPALTEDIWLDDEKAEENTVTDGIVYPGKNFVIDPWTRNKTVIQRNDDGTITLPTVSAETGNGQPFMMTEGATVPSLEYANRYVGEKFSDFWKDPSLTGKKELSKSTANTKPIIIDYTMENTTSVKASQNGYSTGALFKAVYFPKQWSASAKDDEKKDVVKPVDVDYNGETETGTGYDAITTNTEGKTFYVYQANIYKDFAAIFNEFIWEKQKSVSANEKVYSYDDFTTNKITSIDMETFANSTLYTTTVSDPMAYIPYLREKIIAAGDNLKGQNFAAECAIENYLGLTNGKQPHEDVYKNVKKYTNGETYYPYWIRHANNGKPTDMGIMEFGIVRNNVYDMTIEKINGLGLSGMEKPEPDKEDETKDYFFKVIINVKDWVIRNNSGIILQ